MAHSRYEYVKEFEQDITLLPECWIVVRIDGKGFTKFCDLHEFEKPNDVRGLDLMNSAAQGVLQEFPEVRIAYGESDEYSFVLDRHTRLFGRRASKLVSLIASCFTAHYVSLWPRFLGAAPLKAMPMFDGRAVAYPTERCVRDYLSWRQADTHVNNQYNTCFWALVKSGASPAEAQMTLKGTDTGFKNELLFSRFGINYAHLPEQFRKGSVVLRQRTRSVVKQRPDGTPVERERVQLCVEHCDLIAPRFWEEHPEVLA